MGATVMTALEAKPAFAVNQGRQARASSRGTPTTHRFPPCRFSRMAVKGAMLHLRGMFEAYHAQVEGEDAAEEIDAAAASRAVVEREAANVREGRPAR